MTYFGTPPLEQFIDPDSVIAGVPGAPDMRGAQAASTIIELQQAATSALQRQMHRQEIDRTINEMLYGTVRQREGN